MEKFELQDAVAYGLPQAVILHFLRKHRKVSGWVVLTEKEIAKKLPYFSASQVRRGLLRLVELEAIEKDIAPFAGHNTQSYRVLNN